MITYLQTELNFPTVQQAAVLQKTFSNGRQEIWYLLTSMTAEQLSPMEMMNCIRKHWQIENGLHNFKDKILREDEYQGKSDRVLESLCILRNAAVSIFNRLSNPLKRKLSRTKQAIQISCNPSHWIHELQKL